MARSISYSTLVLMTLLASPALGQTLGSPNFQAATIAGGTLTLGSGSSNAGVTQGGTGAVFNMKLGGSTSEFRVSNSSSTQLFGVGQSTNVVRALAPMWLQGATVWSGGNNYSTESQLFANSNWSGTYTGATEFAAWFLGLGSDTVNATSSGAQGGAGLLLDHFMGGAAMTGNRQTLDILTNFSATSGNNGLGVTPPGTAFSALRATAVSTANDNGTALTNVGAMGAAWGANIVVGLASGATFFSGETGLEVDVQTATGASVWNKQGIIIVMTSGDKVAGTNADYALAIANQARAGALGEPGWSAGIMFGGLAGHWPISPTGTMIGATVPTGESTSFMAVANGIDWSSVTFSGFSLKLPGFTVDGAGNVTAASYIGVPLAGSGRLTAGGTFTLPTGWHSVTFKAIGAGGGSGCGIVQTSGTAASGGSTGGTGLPITDTFFSSDSGGTTIVVTMGVAGTSCTASGTANGSTGTTPTAGTNTVVAVGSFSRTAYGGGAGQNGTSNANTASGGSAGLAGLGGNGSGATLGSAGLSLGCAGSSSAAGTTAAFPDGCMGGTAAPNGLAGVNAGTTNSSGVGAGGSGAGLAGTQVALVGGNGKKSVYDGGAGFGSGAASCTGTSQNGGTPGLVAATGSSVSGSGGGGGASCIGSNGGNGGGSSGYGSSGGGGGATSQDGTHTAGSGGISGGGAVWYVVN